MTNYTNGLGGALMNSIALEVAQLLLTNEAEAIKKRQASESSMTAEEVKRFRDAIVDCTIEMVG